MTDTADVLTPEALSFLTDLQREFGARRIDLLERRAARLERLHAGELPDFLPETADVQGGRLARRPHARRDRRPARRDHGARRPQDGDQRAQLGREGVHGRLRGLELADLVQLHRRAAQPDRRARANDLTRHGREAVHAGRQPGRPLRAPAWLASGGTALRGGRGADVGLAVRLRPLLLSQPRLGRPLLLPPEARVASRGAALERRLRVVAGSPRRAAGDDQGDGSDRDHSRRVRDGRDPVRAARPLGRPQRGPLGLHLQRDQEARAPTRDGASGSQRRDDGRAVHARVLRAAREDVPPARRFRDGRHGRVHPLAP